MKKLSGKIALVTGGGSGIGRSICLRLAAEGAKVYVSDISFNAASETVNSIYINGGIAIPILTDVANNKNVNDSIASIWEENPIDILVNNAGIAHVGNIENTTEEELDRLYQVNVKGVYNLMHSCVPRMKDGYGGVIINMASVASCVGITDRFAYSMTKGAVLTMTYSVAKDYLNYGIRCNCISPARIHTPFVDNYLDENYPDNRDEMFVKLEQSQPIGRMGRADEVAGLVAYLCSEEAAFITGSNFPIDGGFITLNS